MADGKTRNKKVGCCGCFACAVFPESVVLAITAEVDAKSFKFDLLVLTILPPTFLCQLICV